MLRTLQFLCLFPVVLMGCHDDNPAYRGDHGLTDSLARDLRLDRRTEAGIDLRRDGKLPIPDSLGPGRIAIYIKGDLDPITYTDGGSGQTPTQYGIAVSQYSIMTSATDPSPQLCFQLAAPFEAQIDKDNLVGSCLTQSIKTGLYTHGRTRIDYARYTVSGTLHVPGKDLPGTFTYFRAYSDTTYESKTYKAGTGYVRFKGAVAFELPLTYPPFPTVPGVTTSLVNGQFFWTFAYGKPLPVDQKNPGQHWARFNWKIFESFRWTDFSLPGYTKGVWDVSPLAASIEPILLYGVSSYYVTSSVTP